MVGGAIPSINNLSSGEAGRTRTSISLARGAFPIRPPQPLNRSPRAGLNRQRWRAPVISRPLSIYLPAAR